ncbi:Williams-Beuren syndrome chromosomal region 16 protein [Aphelenchoides fujianensis]|nr:Williams-Beuren syndrome chromosomal region 16 protein [Aphelenchoides fujianensis]
MQPLRPLVRRFRPFCSCSRRFASTSLRELDVAEVEAEKRKEVKDFVGPKANCAIFGAGLTKSGALSIKASPLNFNLLFIPFSLVTHPKAAHALLRPTRIAFLNTKRIRKVAAGLGFSLFASQSILYGSGLNNRHQLGGPMRADGKRHVDEYFAQAHRIALPNEPQIVSIAAGRLHSLVGTADGVFAFGDNAHGQCGQNPDDHPEVAHSLSGLLPRVPLPAGCAPCKQGALHAGLVSGELFAFGLSTDGQLGTGCNDIEWRPERVPIDEEIRFVGGSGDTLVAVAHSGNLYMWGQVEYGQAAEFTDDVHLRLPTLLRFDFGGSPVRSAATTNTSCVVSTEDGRVYTWGSLFLGSGPAVQQSTRPIPLSPHLFADSSGRNGHVKRVFAGLSTCAALNEANHLFTWGSNRHGALGLGHDRDQLFPLQVFLSTDVKTVALGPDHTLITASSYYN